MGMLWDIIDAVRSELSETGKFRSVLVGDIDIPASLLPAARVRLEAVIADATARIPIIIDAKILVDILFSPKTTENEMITCGQKAAEMLTCGEYPAGTRIIAAPQIKKNHANKSMQMKLTIRWAERSE